MARLAQWGIVSDSGVFHTPRFCNKNFVAHNQTHFISIRYDSQPPHPQGNTQKRSPHTPTPDVSYKTST